MRTKTGVIKSGLAFGILLLLATAFGCSGGGDGSTAQTGVFLDSPVSGLGYATATQEGMTGIGGAFRYQQGETVRFHIGDFQLCLTEARPVVTPLDCVAEAMDENHPMVTNMLMLLQSLDYDNDPANGIDITEVMHREARNLSLQLELNSDPNEFRHNYEFRHYLDLVEAMNGFQYQGERLPPEIEQARQHMRQTMMENHLYGYGPGMQTGYDGMTSPPEESL